MYCKSFPDTLTFHMSDIPQLDCNWKINIKSLRMRICGFLAICLDNVYVLVVLRQLPYFSVFSALVVTKKSTNTR